MSKGSRQRMMWLIGFVCFFLVPWAGTQEANAFAQFPVAQKKSTQSVRKVIYGEGGVLVSVPNQWQQIEQQVVSPEGYQLTVTSKDQRSGMWLAIVPNDGRAKIDLDEALDRFSGNDDLLTQRCTYVGRQDGEAPGYRSVADRWIDCNNGVQWIRLAAKPQAEASPSYAVILQAYFVDESEDAAWQTTNQVLASLEVDPAQLLLEMSNATASLSPLVTPTPTSSGSVQPKLPKGHTAPSMLPRSRSTALPDVTEWQIFLPLIMKSQPAPATPVPTAPAVTVSEVVVRVNALNVRSGPGVNYPVIASANQNDRFPVTGMVNNCAWLQVLLPMQKVAWVSGGSQYTSLQGSCSNVPAVAVPPAPKARANAGQGCYLFRNYISDELTVTFTNKEGNWNTTFKVPKRGSYRACFNPGQYTYTIDVPPPWGSINGMVEVTSGMYQEWPVWGEN